jgi:hypothetical protein
MLSLSVNIYFRHIIHYIRHGTAIKQLNDIKEDKTISDYPWFMARSFETKNIPSSAKKGMKGYASGTYLEYILDMLLIMQYLFLISSILPVLNEFAKSPIENIKTLFSPSFLAIITSQIFLVGILSFALAIIGVGHLHTIRRRDIIENELLSIDSQSNSWRLSIIVYYRSTINAFKQAKTDKSGGFNMRKAYHQNVIEEISEITKNLFDIEKYFNDCIDTSNMFNEIKNTGNNINKAKTEKVFPPMNVAMPKFISPEDGQTSAEE